jgi:hypothetical protein
MSATTGQKNTQEAPSTIRAVRPISPQRFGGTICLTASTATLIIGGAFQQRFDWKLSQPELPVPAIRWSESSLSALRMPANCAGWGSSSCHPNPRRPPQRRSALQYPQGRVEGRRFWNVIDAATLPTSRSRVATEYPHVGVGGEVRLWTSDFGLCATEGCGNRAVIVSTFQNLAIKELGPP